MTRTLLVTRTLLAKMAHLEPGEQGFALPLTALQLCIQLLPPLQSRKSSEFFYIAVLIADDISTPRHAFSLHSGRRLPTMHCRQVMMLHCAPMALHSI